MMSQQKRTTKENQSLSIHKETYLKPSDMGISMMESYLDTVRSNIKMVITLKGNLKMVKNQVLGNSFMLRHKRIKNDLWLELHFNMMRLSLRDQYLQFMKGIFKQICETDKEK